MPSHLFFMLPIIKKKWQQPCQTQSSIQFYFYSSKSQQLHYTVKTYNHLTTCHISPTASYPDISQTYTDIYGKERLLYMHSDFSWQLLLLCDLLCLWWGSVIPLIWSMVYLLRFSDCSTYQPCFYKIRSMVQYHTNSLAKACFFFHVSLTVRCILKQTF